MGYTHHLGYTLPRIIDYITRDQDQGNGVVSKTIKSERHRLDLWTVMARYRDGIETERYIVLFALGHDREGAGYKDISESMGPWEDTCPISFFDLVPQPPNEWGAQFRERCRQADAERRHAAAAIKNLTAGDTIALPDRYPVHAFDFLRKDKSAVVARGSDGVIYKLRPKIMAVATVLKAGVTA